MSYGVRTKNLTKGNTTIDDSLRSYRYLGKYLIPTTIGTQPTVDFTCAGFPQIYHDVPYNITAQENTSSPYSRMLTRSGISLARLDNLGGNSWRATFTLNNVNGPVQPWYMRVFGRLDLAPVTGPGYGFLVKNLQGDLIFDSRCRPLRLAGDTYNTEITLPYLVPDTNDSTANVEQYDTWVELPFDMAGVSICATARGLIRWPYFAGNYVEDGQLIYRYDVCDFQTLYWANGARLYARRVGINTTQIELAAPTSIDLSRAQIVYSRLATITNSLFP